MLKDAILESYNKLIKENDNIPVGIRGELEVISRDRAGNILSYDVDHNEITKWMKHAIIHLLAGNIFSEQKTGGIYSKIQGEIGFHSTGPTKANGDGMLLTGKQFFHDGLSASGFSFGNAIPSGDSYVCPTYPTKMLFGTGKEYSVDEQYIDLLTYYGLATDGGETELEKFLGSGVNSANYKNNIDNSTNYYSNTLNSTSDGLKRCRTIQPADFTNIDTSNPVTLAKDETGITGAIKDCLITNFNTQNDNFDTVTGMANSLFRGVGRPAFIYGERDETGLHSSNVTSGNVNISKYSTTANYEDKITFSVVMPQNNQSEFYPYNGWILKEAGLFSDSLLRIAGNLDNSPSFFKMPSGIMLAKRYIKPIMKTADTEIEFRWSIYIAE